MSPLKFNHRINAWDQNLRMCLPQMNNQLTTSSAPAATLETVMRKEITHLTILLQCVPLPSSNKVRDSGAESGEVHNLSARQDSEKVSK